MRSYGMTMTSFGTLEYVFDDYSKKKCWKVTGTRAIQMISGVIDQSWYGSGDDEVIIPDSTDNVRRIQQIHEQYQFEILSKSVWQKRSRIVRPKRSKMPKIEKLERAKPGEQFAGKLMNFQREGLDFLIKSNGNALLADEMGLGKTVQTLAYLATEQDAFPALIVAPLVTLNNWQREIRRFLYRKDDGGSLFKKGCPTSTIIRTGKRGALGRRDFYIINYELLHRREADLSKVGLRSIVYDEVQNLRSKSTLKYGASKKLARLPTMIRRVGLSGTPIYNHGSEIWPIVEILRPGLLGNFSEFCEYYCYVNNRGKAIVLEGEREKLRELLQKYVMLRRKKSDVLKDLKEKVRYKEVIDADTEYYVAELNAIWRDLQQEQRNAKSSFDRLASYQRAIRKERQVAAAAKIPHIIDFVSNIMEIEESVVVFCHHRVIHKILSQSLSEFDPAVIIGSQSDKVRQAEIDRFQAGETKLMIAGLRAGNVGINLTRARYVVFAELDWSPAIHRQAEDRLHRIGQENTVFAYYLIGNRTMDEHVADVLVDKSYEIDSIIDGKTDTFEDKEKAEMILAQIQDRLYVR